jgi:hypothetical protein
MMLGVMMTMAVLACSTCAGQCSSRVQTQGSTPNWLPTSGQAAAVVQEHLRLTRLHIVDRQQSSRLQ